MKKYKVIVLFTTNLPFMQEEINKIIDDGYTLENVVPLNDSKLFFMFSKDLMDIYNDIWNNNHITLNGVPVPFNFTNDNLGKP